MSIIFTFLKQAYNESSDFSFATAHSLMKDINLIDSCKSHLPVQCASIIKCIRARRDTSGVIDSEPHLSRTCKTSFTFHQACRSNIRLSKYRVLGKLYPRIIIEFQITGNDAEMCIFYEPVIAYKYRL